MRKFFIILFVFLFLPVSVFADGEFHSKYVVDHVFDVTGASKITQHISLKNLKSEVYASKYQLLLQGEVPKNIVGADSSGPLKISSSDQGQDKTLVTVEFNDQVVGIGNSLNFRLEYEGRPATHNGQVWEIILPKLGNPEAIDDYELNLITPPQFGTLAFVSPQPRISLANKYTFSKEQMTKVGVVAAFGNFQTFSFNLSYHLENSQDTPVYTEVALPADTNYQRVFYDAIVPAPQSVTVDGDGNWLARFDLKPLENLTIVTSGQAHILAEPTQIFATQTNTPLSTYLLPTALWQADDTGIKKLAQQLKTPQAIYDYVVETLTYDYSKIKPGNIRLGAKQTLATPSQSVCTEFTDLFIALARAAGIPAREVNGYAYTTNAQIRPLSLVSDILHAWPQYWDAKRKLWVNIDPTWGNTTGGVDYFNKLDFSHFAFVTHGISDSQPLAAGLYKQSANSRDVAVNFTQYKDYPVQPLEITWENPWQIIPFLPSKLLLVIKNNQGQAVYNTDVEVTSGSVKVKKAVKSRIGVMPPYSQVSEEVIISPHTLLGFSSKTIEVRVGEQVLTYNVPTRLYLAWQIGIAIGLTTFIIILAILAGRTWSIYLQRREPGNSLRGQGKKPSK